MKRLFALIVALALCASAALAEGAGAVAPELVEAVLDALGEGPYRAAWEALSEGQTVARGTRGEAARGVQETLIAFGQEISADGNAGPKTLAALNAVQAAYGLEQTDAVDAAGYARLLIRLLAQTDLEAASELLPEALGGEYQYICGCVHAQAGRYYSAKRCFELSAWGDWQARVASCDQPWPATGRLYRNEGFKSFGTELTVRAGGDGDTATLVRLYTRRGVLVAELFVAGSGEAKTSLPAGIYTVKYGTGQSWYGGEAFGEEGVYGIMTFDDGARQVHLRSGKAYLITIDAPEDTPDARDVGTAYENWERF